MMYLKLDTGSLDFALSKKNDFIFFEVNPVGHFGANSFFCGLNLEKEIAKRLIK